MSIAALVRRMAEAGAPTEAIALAVEAVEVEQAKVEQRRAKDRERKARQRDRERDSHVTVTGQDRDGHRTEPPIDSTRVARVEDNPSSLVPSGEENKRTPHSPPRGAKRGTRIPDDWQPDILAARREGLSEPEALREGERFRDYFRAAPSAKGVKLDWPATWRNWCKNAVDRRPRGPDPPRKSLSQLARMPIDEAIP